MTSSEVSALPQWSDYLALLAKADNVLDLLSDTPMVTAKDRPQTLRQRLHGAEWRHRW